MELTAEEARVVGCLIEKQMTTPDLYPLTLNSLVAACNQSSSRDPVVSYSSGDVERTLSSLKDKGLVRWVHPSHGRSVTRYRQVIDEVTGMDDRQLALLAVLMLRGPQTVGELRTRTDRMVTFPSTDDVENDLALMAKAEDPAVERLPQRPGQREARYVHLFVDPAAGEAQVLAAAAAAAAPVVERERGSGSSLADRVAALEDQLAVLRATVDELVAGLGGGEGL